MGRNNENEASLAPQIHVCSVTRRNGSPDFVYPLNLEKPVT